MAGYGKTNSLKGLELVMNHNMQVFSNSSSSSTTTTRHGNPMAAIVTHYPDRNQNHIADWDSYPMDHAASIIASPSSNPIPAFASLSLALSNTALSSNLFLHCQNRTVPAPAPTAAADPALLSQKKCIASSPVVSSSSAFAAASSSSSILSTTSQRRNGKTGLKFTTAFPDYHRLPDHRRGSGEPGGGAALRRTSIVWFRNDLRVHDHEALSAANADSLSILPVYIFDPADYGRSLSGGFDKTGPYRARFVRECVAELRESLRMRGCDLVVRLGRPEEVLPALARSAGADALYTHREVSREEVVAEKRVADALREDGVDVKLFWGSTLFHIDDLPFQPDHVPTTFGGFREATQHSTVRDTVRTPQSLKSLPSRGDIEPGDIPSLKDLDVKSPVSHSQGFRVLTTRRTSLKSWGSDGKWSFDLAVHLNNSTSKDYGAQNAIGNSLVGGESMALQRLESFITKHRESYSKMPHKDISSDNLFGANFACKISPWLATGCLSPRRIYEDIKNITRSFSSATVTGVKKEDSKDLLVFELLWRDFFRFITRKYSSMQDAVDAVPAGSAIPA